MNTVSHFVTRFSSLILWVFSSFDRVIFKGHLPIGWVDEFQRFVDYKLKVTRKDYLKRIAPLWSERLVNHAKAMAERLGRQYEYRAGRVDKDAWAKEQLRQSGVTEGLLGVLGVMESCPTFKLAYAKGRPRFVSKRMPQRVLYYYFVDRRLGLIHVRLQTCAPFPCQIYANGHEFVARELKRKGLKFEQIDNAFTMLSDVRAAQRVADRFAKLPWPKMLERYAKRVNPLLSKELTGLCHYWVVDQAEYATDVRFADEKVLAVIFQRLLAFALQTFSPPKIFAYLGRRYHERYDGEVQTHYRSERTPGACIKHVMKRNWLKMYDKLGLMLRVETVINQPGEFSVYRECHHRDGSKSKGWYRMRKGVGNLHHYQSQALACNRRYLDALAAVADPTPAHDTLKLLTERRRRHERSYAGFNPCREDDVRLFAAVLKGDHVARGFQNRDIRLALNSQNPAAVGRLLKRLHVRGLILKIPRTRRWRVSDTRRTMLSDTLQTYRRYVA